MVLYTSSVLRPPSLRRDWCVPRSPPATAQAQIQEIVTEDDPLRLAEDEQAWAMTLRADGPEYVPVRVFRDGDLLALMGALSNLNKGERAVARLMLRSLDPSGRRPT